MSAAHLEREPQKKCVNAHSICGRTRWEETLKQSTSFPDLQRAVKFNGPSSPCVAGCRSVCWKVSLSV